MATAPESGSVTPLDVVRLLRSAGSALLTQAGLHGQLARVEWAAEKSRIARMAAAALIVFIALLCALLMAGVLVLVISWDTSYRVPAAIGLVVFYVACAALAWYRFKALSARSREAFAGTREELAADVDLIRSRL